MKVLMPTAVPEGLDLDPDLADVEVVSYDQDASIPPEHRDAEVVVAWVNPRAKVVEIAATMPQLRLMQCLGSGPESFLTAGFREGVQIARGIDLHNVPVAEHALALLLAAARRLDMARDAQNQARWAAEITGNQLVTRGGFTTIAGSRFVIWGLGRIGQTLAGFLRALGGSVTGIGRVRDVRDGIAVLPPHEAASVLGDADALITVLPDRKGALGVVDKEVLERLPAHAWFVNVGRGSTVVEADLVEALGTGSIAGAALDVFGVEPLPEGSPLWQLPNVIVTPHSAGGRPMGSSALINENLRRLRAGQEPLGLLT